MANEKYSSLDTNINEHMIDCILCAGKLIYFNEPKEMECGICHGKFFSNVQCEHGHYICDECHSGNGIKLILEVCRTTLSTDPIEIMQKLMAQPCIHMHGPEHHVMVGAALLATYHNSGGNIDLNKALTEIDRRGKQVPGGACGFWGSCGAAVSAGMYISIVTGSTPLSKEAWSLSNRMTSEALKEISLLGGPRCCKRNSFTAAISAVDFTQRYLSVNMKRVVEIHCSFSKYNHECLGGICPYNSHYDLSKV